MDLIDDLKKDLSDLVYESKDFIEYNKIAENISVNSKEIINQYYTSYWISFFKYLRLLLKRKKLNYE